MKTMTTLLLLGALATAGHAEKPALKEAGSRTRVSCNLGEIAIDWNFANGPQGFQAVECDNGGEGPLWEHGWSWLVPEPPGTVWGTILNSNYPNDRGQGLRSPQFLITEHSSLVEVQHRFDIEPGYDGGNLVVLPHESVWTPEGGYSFPTISADPGYYAHCVDGEPGWSGMSDGWRVDCFDLSEFLGQQVQIEFDFGADSSVVDAGWYLARVRVGGPGSSERACCDLLTGDCLLLPEAFCLESGRVWHPEATTCDPSPCPPPCPFQSIAIDWDFGQGDQGFQAVGCDGGGEPVWEYGLSDKLPGPPAIVWGTLLQGEYPNSAGEALVSPEFPVTAGTRMVEVWHAFATEAGYDGGNVVVSAGGGPDQIVFPFAGYSVPAIAPGAGQYAPCVDNEPGWSGSSGSWRVDCFDLAPWVGSTARLSFHFGSDQSVTGPGWFLKRVRVGAPPAPPYTPTLQATGWYNAEPWNHWIGPSLEQPGVTQLELSFQFPDLAPEIQFVDFYWDSLGTWVHLGRDEDGADPWFDTFGSAAPVGNGWALRATLPEPMPFPTPMLTFRGVAHLPGRAELPMETSVPYDPAPPNRARSSLETWQTVDDDTLGIQIDPNGITIDSVAVYLRRMPPIYEKGIPGISQQPHSPTHCVPAATAQCLKYFEAEHGDTEITGGLDDFGLVEALSGCMMTNEGVEPGTYLRNWIGGLGSWISEHGGGYTMRSYRHYDDLGWTWTTQDWLRMRNELERSQDVLVGVFWRSGGTYIGGHALTLNGIANTPQPDGRYLLDFQDPWTASTSYGLLNVETGAITLTGGAGGTGALAQVGATIIVCPREERPGYATGALRGYSGPNPWPQPVRVRLPEEGKWFVDVVVVNDRGHAFGRTSVVVLDTSSGLDRGEPARPLEFALGAARPNPFRESTDLLYALASRATLRITVHDAAGRRVRTLTDGIVEAGTHRVAWDGRDDRGLAASTGIYFVRMTASVAAGTEESRVGRVMLLR